jgi:hypothetical protein
MATRGQNRIWKTEGRRLGKLAQELGADLEIDPVTGKYKLVFPKEGDAARPDQPQTNEWDTEYGADKTQAR